MKHTFPLYESEIQNNVLKFSVCKNVYLLFRFWKVILKIFMKEITFVMVITCFIQ